MKYNKDNRKFEGIWIPSEVWFDRELSLIEKIFLIEINSLDNDKGCYASNAYFSQFFNLSTARCSQIISSLKNKQFLTIEYIYKGKEIEKRIIKIASEGIKYIKGGIKKRQKRDKYNNTVSKDTVLGSQKEPRQVDLNSSIGKIIKFWLNSSNDAPAIVTHKFSPTNKTIQRIHQSIKSLKNGTFGKRHNLDAAFLTKHKIPIELARTKWTDDEIKDTLGHLLNYCRSGFFPGVDPDNKGNNRKVSLEHLLYNSNTGSSIFLWVHIKHPKRAGHHSIKILNEAALKEYRQLFNGSFSQKEEGTLIRIVNKLVREQQGLVEDLGQYMSHTNFSSYIGSEKNPMPFFKLHAKWLGGWKKLPLSQVGIGSTGWDKFVDWLREEHKIKLYPTDKEMKIIKKEHDRSLRRTGGQ